MQFRRKMKISCDNIHIYIYLEAYMTTYGLIVNVLGGGRFKCQFSEKNRKTSSELTVPAVYFQAAS